MLYQWIRLIKSVSAVLTDFSLDNQEEGTNVNLNIDPSVDTNYFHLGQHFPFNNFNIQMDTTVNTTASAIDIEYWTGQGNGWKNCVDILDATSVGGVPCSRSGVIQFSPDQQFNWKRVADTLNEPQPMGLELARVYNVYWIRFRWTTVLDNPTNLARLMYKFSSTQQLDNLDTNINEFQTSFESGKTNWDDEIITASLQVAMDLKRKGLILHRGQVLRFDDVSMATDIKTLILIYRNLGSGFRQKLEDALLDYEKAFPSRFTFDKDLDGFTDFGEIANRVKVLAR